MHTGTRLSGPWLQAPLIGKRYRCLICADFDLCDGCFNGGHHPQHAFAVKDTPQVGGNAGADVCRALSLSLDAAEAWGS